MITDSRETSEEEVETAFEARAKRNKKSRCREEGVHNNNNPNNPPPPTKRRKQFLRRQNLISHEHDSDPVCDQPLQSDQDQNNVCFDARVPPQLDEAKQDNNLSNSTTAEKRYFPLFNSDLPRPGRGGPSKVRKQMKSIIIPPANNSMITDHFRPARTNSKRRDDENIHLVPASVDCVLLSSPLRDQVHRRC